MNPEKNPGENLETNNSELPTNESKSSVLEQEKSVEEYIFGSLLYTPQFYAKNEKYVYINVYAPGENQPSMQIFRMIFRVEPLQKEGEDLTDLKEVAFQDQVKVIKGGKVEKDTWWQVNFSVLVDKETFEYKSIREKPNKVLHLSESIDVFKDLSKQKGSRLHAGDWRFESDGNGWVPVGPDGNAIDASKLKSLSPSLPSIE